MKVLPKVKWPLVGGWYIVENTVPEGERLDGGKGMQTIRRVILVEVLAEGRSRYTRGGDRYPSWQPAGTYVTTMGDEGQRPIQMAFDGWDGLRFVPLDLDAIAEQHRFAADLASMPRVLACPDLD